MPPSPPPTGHKVGLVGRNGTEKTTLFGVICGDMVLDTGEINIPKGWKIGGVRIHRVAWRHLRN